MMTYKLNSAIQKEAWGLLNEEIKRTFNEDSKIFDREQNYLNRLNFALRLNYIIPYKKTRGREKFTPHFPEKLLKQILQRLETNIQFLTANEDKCCFDLEQDWRLVVGLGTASVRDTSMILHHIYGMPYLPSSAIKGVLRSYIIETVFGNSEAKAIQSEEFAYFFGTPEQLKPNEKSYDGKAHKGKLVILDAFPISMPHIQKDVMTNHYQAYYEKKEVQPTDRQAYYEKIEVQPTDSLTPNPILFLTVQNCTFRFFLGLRDTYNIEEKQFKEKSIRTWLMESLAEFGIGAKSAVGYGYFRYE